MMVLGIDTSNYRTSICLINDAHEMIAEHHPLLQVQEGELGLQQSKAVFEHLKAWPALLDAIPRGASIQAVGVSTTPRPVEGSYMPVFKVGEVLAQTIAHFLSIPLFHTSHQEGHIAAGEYSVMHRPKGKEFLAVHLSGGTSEILWCQRCAGGYAIKRLGGTIDLHAGQFVDRVGVQLGLPFPAGPHLESLAHTVDHTEGDIPIIPSYTNECDFSFSGPTSAALRMIDQNEYEPAQIARAVENTITKTLEKALKSAMFHTGTKEILIVGGVAANQYIRKRLKKKLEHHAVRGQIYAAKPRYATDNAFGVACIAFEKWKKAQQNMNN